MLERPRLNRRKFMIRLVIQILIHPVVIRLRHADILHVIVKPPIDTLLCEGR